MGVEIALTEFCHIQCDELNCGKKVHHYGEQVLKQMAKLLGWKNMGDKWLCPLCAQKNEQETSNRAMAEKAIESLVS